MTRRFQTIAPPPYPHTRKAQEASAGGPFHEGADRGLLQGARRSVQRQVHRPFLHDQVGCPKDVLGVFSSDRVGFQHPCLLFVFRRGSIPPGATCLIPITWLVVKRVTTFRWSSRVSLLDLVTSTEAAYGSLSLRNLRMPWAPIEVGEGPGAP